MLKKNPKPLALKRLPQSLQGLPDRSRMMTEIVDHFHPACFAAQFLPPRDPGKTFQGVVDLRFGYIVKPRRRHSHCGIAHIEFADERNFINVVAQLET